MSISSLTTADSSQSRGKREFDLKSSSALAIDGVIRVSDVQVRWNIGEVAFQQLRVVVASLV